MQLNWIREKRLSKGLSQAKLAKLTGIVQALLSSWELDKDKPSEKEEAKIKNAFKEFDALVKTGQHKNFFKKTSWKRDYLNSDCVGKSQRSAIDEELISAYVNKLPSDKKIMTSAIAKIGKNSPTAIALFAGCGGMSLGFSYAGFNVKAFMELEDSFRPAYQANFSKAKCIGSDIRKVTNQELVQQKMELGEIDVIFGGPPCQGFSLTGKRDAYDPRNQLYKEFARVATIFNPKVVVLENVRLLTSMKTPEGNFLLDDLLKTFEGIGYNMSYGILNAQNFGAPQFRERIFFLGLRKDIFGSLIGHLPLPSHGLKEGNTLFDDIKPCKTFRDAVQGLEVFESGESSDIDPLHFAVSHPKHVIEMLKNVPEGCSAHENKDPNLRPRSGYNTTYKRLCWDEPSSTISTTFGMISGSRNVHPVATRSLTIREAMRCQTFPDDFRIFGTLGEIRTMIGNAVPPLLAKSIANHVRSSYLKKEKDQSLSRELVEVSGL